MMLAGGGISGIERFRRTFTAVKNPLEHHTLTIRTRFPYFYVYTLLFGGLTLSVHR